VIGGLNLKRIFGKAALAIFVQPPSYEELEKRLRDRSTETEEKIEQRMAKAINELSFAEDFDIILVNDKLETAIASAKESVLNFLKS
jgi:guanylate kinase